MAIDTYAKLQSEIQDTIDRDDLLADVTAYASGNIEGAITRAIRRCELRIQRTLRVRDMETSTTIAFVSGTTTIALPSDFLSARLFYLNIDPIAILKQDTLENVFSSYPNAAVAQPVAFAVTGSNMVARPVSDGSYSAPFYYYQSIPALTTANTSNWLLVKAVDAYLYGSCLELMPHIHNDPRIQTWKGFFDEAISLLEEDDNAAKWNGVLVSSVLPIQIVV
mgnify:CR=1 FL=1